MSLWLKDPNAPPEQGWQYPGIDGTPIKATCWQQLCGKVAQHYTTNGKPAPTCDEVLKWVCDNLPVACYEGRAPYRNPFTDPPSYAQRGLKGPNWPPLLVPLKLLAKETDRGLGDIVERVIGPVGGDLYKKWYEKIFGKPCGCQERQESLNADFPL